MSNVKIGSQWETLVELQTKREYYAMVAIGWDRIAIAGGWDLESRSFLDSVSVWNLRTKEWSTYKMKEARKGCAAVAIEEKLYVFGGWNRDYRRLSSCEYWDLSIDRGTSESVSLS